MRVRVCACVRVLAYACACVCMRVHLYICGFAHAFVFKCLLHLSTSINDVKLYDSTHCTQGTTELTLQPLSGTGKVWKINLNCKQCRVLHISVNEAHTASFSYADATLRVTPADSKKYVTLPTSSLIGSTGF